MSHPLLPHSSTPLLFYELTSILALLVALRTAIALYSPSHSSSTHLASLVILPTKLFLFLAVFSLELLGPDGWDPYTWRDWLSWLPFVEDENRGKIRLGEDPVDEDGWDQKECPRIRANIFERLTFSWLTPLSVLSCPHERGLQLRHLFLL